MIGAARERLAAQVRLNGRRGAARVLLTQLRGSLYADESHVWYDLSVDDVRDLPMREGFVLHTGTPADIALVDRIPPVSAHLARTRLREGNDLRMVLDVGRQVAFVCWLLRGSAPALGVPGGALPLPLGVVDLEDSVAPPDYRGGTGSAGVAQILRTLRGTGVRSVVTRVSVDNIASRRAAGKVGFLEVATVTVRRRGRRTRSTVRPAPGSELHWLVQAYQRQPGAVSLAPTA